MRLPWNLGKKNTDFCIWSLREKHLLIFLAGAYLHRVDIYNLTVVIILNS